MLSIYKGFCLLTSVLCLFTGEASADALGDLQTKGRTAINTQLAKSTTCTAAKLQVRKEWGNVSVADRKAYIKAVLCLMSAPSKLPAGKFPGAQNRYDDFVVTHMQQTLQIHGTGSFFSWHRYYTWAYEQALRNECGYNGTQPYWDFGKWTDPEKSPIFDGTDTSMSGNGKKVSHKATSVGPAQNGGGCVETGPFANMTVRLGPVSPMADPAPPKNPRSDGYGINTRCLRRDIGPYLVSKGSTTAMMVNLITSKTTIGPFQDTMQGGNPGVHTSAHFTIGSDPGGDFYTSPNDPAFWLLHGQIDRLWTIWQSQDLPNRMQVIAGGTSMMGGGAAQKLTDNIDISNVASKVYQIKDLVSITDGPFCYVYE